jgi:putative ABC transport system ATP-binding protein
MKEPYTQLESDSQPLVEVRHVSRLYGPVRALDDVSLVIKRGEMVAVMGPSGSGKSTLLNVLGTLDVPTSGEIVIAGQELSCVRDVDQLRAQVVGFVFQQHNLMPILTALENIMVPMRGGSLSRARQRRRAMELLGRVGLADHADRFAPQLSGGEAQRVAVARALANAPPLILADEPTGNLDSQSGADVLELLQEMNAEFGMTLVMVTHDPVVALSTRRILTLRDGRIEQDEPVEAVYLQEMQQVSHTRLGRLLFGERAEVLSEPRNTADAERVAAGTISPWAFPSELRLGFSSTRHSGTSDPVS